MSFSFATCPAKSLAISSARSAASAAPAAPASRAAASDKIVCSAVISLTAPARPSSAAAAG